MGAENMRGIADMPAATKTGDYGLPPQVKQDTNIDAPLKFGNSGVRLEDLADVARLLEWTVDTRKVMVFLGDTASPIRRIEIEINHPSALLETADALANAVQARGLALRITCEPRMPVNEIWLTFPDNDGSCVLTWFGDSHKASI
jgi:hypothetical protein